MWSKKFMESQRYIHNIVLYQDNKATRLLLKNGKASSGKCTRHLNIRYFYLHNLIKKKLMKAEYCSTSVMIVDFSQNHYRQSILANWGLLSWDKNDKVQSVYMNTGVCWRYKTICEILRDEFYVILYGNRKYF